MATETNGILDTEGGGGRMKRYMFTMQTTFFVYGNGQTLEGAWEDACDNDMDRQLDWDWDEVSKYEIIEEYADEEEETGVA